MPAGAAATPARTLATTPTVDRPVIINVMALIAVKLLLAPNFVVGASLAARRFGPRIGGLVAGLPLVAGPILLVYALAHGRAFAAGAAAGTLLGLVSLTAFVVVYARLAGRLFWGASMLAGWLAFVLATVVVQRAVGPGGRSARAGGRQPAGRPGSASSSRLTAAHAYAPARLGPAAAGGVRAGAGARADCGVGLAGTPAQRPAGAVSDDHDGACDLHPRTARAPTICCGCCAGCWRLRGLRPVLLHAGGAAGQADTAGAFALATGLALLMQATVFGDDAKRSAVAHAPSRAELVADAVAQLGEARGLVADQRDEQRGQRGEGDERGGLERDLDEHQRGQDASAEQPLAVERVDVAPAEGDVREQVDGAAAEHRGGAHETERIARRG